MEKDRSSDGDKSVQSEEDTVNEAVKRFSRAMDYSSRNRDLAQDDVDFRNGDQWPEGIRKERTEDDRPCLTFNKMEQRIDQVIGDQRMAKPAIKVLPADIDSDTDAPNKAGTQDYKLSEVMNGLIRSIEQNSDAQVAYNTGFDHAVGHGFGYWRIVTEWDENDPFSQVIRIKRVKNSFSVYLDPDCVDPSGKDANYGFITSLMDKEVFKRKWPKADAQDWSLEGEGDNYDFWYEGDNIRVCEYFRRIPVKKKAVLVSDGSVFYLDTAEQVRILEEKLKGTPFQIDKQKDMEVPKVEWYKLSARDVLETPVEFPSFYIPIVRCIGKELNVRGYDYYRGVIRFAKDAQRLYNYNRTAQVEQVALQPKVPFIMTAEQVEGLESMWDRANKDNLPYLLYNHMDGQPAPRREGPPIPSTAHQINAISDDADIDATTGLGPASLGQQGNEKSGVAIRERKLEGDVSTYAFHDNQNISLKHTGRILVDMIPRIYDTQRVVRIMTVEENDDFVELNKTIKDENGVETVMHDLRAGKYDIRVEAGPSFTTMRQEARESMLEFAQAMPEAGALIADMIVQNMDWPKAEAVAERLKKMLPEGIAEGENKEGDEEITPEMVNQAVNQAVEQAMVQSGQQLEEMKVQINEMAAQSKTETDEYRAITDRMKALSGMQVDEERLKDLVAQSIAEIISAQPLQ